jgi:site-specific recombinase XerD
MPYPYLIKQRDRWFVRMVVPTGVRDIIGQAIFKVPTGHRDERQAATASGAIIAALKQRISTAREAGKRLEQVTAERLAARYHAERGLDPDAAEIIKITDVVAFVLKTHGHSWVDHAKQVRAADYDIHAALRLLPDGEAAGRTADRITGHTTPFLTYLERWKPHAGLKPRPLDQAASSITQFAKAVGKPLEQIEAKDVQAWIDGLIAPEAKAGLSSKTVNRKLGEIRNYWKWMQSLQLIPEDRNPFSNRRVRDPVNRRRTKEEMRQRFRPEDVVHLWTTAEQKHDPYLAASIKISGYSGARIEGIARLRTTDIRIDPDTGIRFMRMNDKTAAGDRFIPIHPKLDALINRLIKDAEEGDYLIQSDAKNKYGERSQPLGKKFGRLKAELGFDDRFVFHGIRHTVAHLFETAECPPGVAKDIIGYCKTEMIFGIYSGETRMDHRARWIAKALQYPPVKEVRHRVPEKTGPSQPAAEPVELHPTC